MKQSQWQSLHNFYQKGRRESCIHGHKTDEERAVRRWALAVNTRKHPELMQCFFLSVAAHSRNEKQKKKKKRKVQNLISKYYVRTIYEKKETCEFCMGPFTSAELPQDLDLQGHMQTSAILVT